MPKSTRYAHPEIRFEFYPSQLLSNWVVSPNSLVNAMNDRVVLVQHHDVAFDQLTDVSFFLLSLVIGFHTLKSLQIPPFLPHRAIMASATRTIVQKLQAAYPWTSIPLVVGAPMRILSGAKLAAAVSRAGGLGFIGPGAKPQDLEASLEEATSLLSETSTYKTSANTLPFGIGIQTWAGDLSITSAILKDYRPSPVACWLFAPRHGQSELDDWAKTIRSVSPSTQIWIQVASVADALAAAVSPHRPDVLVVQGHDAGGHSLTQGASLITLLPEVLDVFDAKGISIPVVAAGGIADARGGAAAFALGAAGICIGTRLLASKEANINPGYQRHVVAASDGGQSTVKTQLYNHLRGTMDWPAGFDARGLINGSWRDHVGGMAFEENKALHEDAMKKGEHAWGESGRTATYAGTNVGLIKDVQPAGDIVQSIRDGLGGVLRHADDALQVQ